MSALAARYKNSPRGALPPKTSARKSTSPCTFTAGAKTVPVKKPEKFPPGGAGSPAVPVLPPPPSAPLPIAIGVRLVPSCTNTPWLRTAPLTCATKATRAPFGPPAKTVAGFAKATGFSVPAPPNASPCLPAASASQGGGQAWERPSSAGAIAPGRASGRTTSSCTRT